MTPEAVAEREAVVRWLREQRFMPQKHRVGKAHWIQLVHLADAIAAGQHLERSPEQMREG